MALRRHARLMIYNATLQDVFHKKEHYKPLRALIAHANNTKTQRCATGSGTHTHKLGMHNIFRTHKFVIMGDFVLSADNETIS